MQFVESHPLETGPSALHQVLLRRRGHGVRWSGVPGCFCQSLYVTQRIPVLIPVREDNQVIEVQTAAELLIAKFRTIESFQPFHVRKEEKRVEGFLFQLDAQPIFRSSINVDVASSGGSICDLVDGDDAFGFVVTM